MPLFFSGSCSAAWLLLCPMFIFCCYSNKPAATLCVSLKLLLLLVGPKLCFGGSFQQFVFQTGFDQFMYASVPF